MPKLLIVEDEVNVAKMIEAAISIVGYEGDICDDGNRAVEIILNNDYDLVLLDVMLPGIDGFRVIEKIQNKNTPVIFLTAMQDVSDKVKGLRLGAEDYIVKPFEAVELLARIDVVLRRNKKSCNMLYFDDVVVDMEKHAALKKNKPVALTPKEFDVLAFFIMNVDIALTRERLLTSVWGYTYEGESRTVDTHVQQVRKKMGLYDSLIAIPKLGYRLNSK